MKAIKHKIGYIVLGQGCWVNQLFYESWGGCTMAQPRHGKRILPIIVVLPNILMIV